MKRAISTYLFCVVVLVIGSGANTLTNRSNCAAIQSNTIGISENTQSIESLATLQEQSVETKQRMSEILETIQTAIDKQGRVLSDNAEQMRALSEKMGVSDE